MKKSIRLWQLTVRFLDRVSKPYPPASSSQSPLSSDHPDAGVATANDHADLPDTSGQRRRGVAIAGWAPADMPGLDEGPDDSMGEKPGVPREDP